MQLFAHSSKNHNYYLHNIADHGFEVWRLVSTIHKNMAADHRGAPPVGKYIQQTAYMYQRQKTHAGVQLRIHAFHREVYYLTVYFVIVMDILIEVWYFCVS